MIAEPRDAANPGGGAGAGGQQSPAARRVVKNTALLVGSDALTKVSLFVLYAVIARSLGARGFGDYTLAISLAFFVSAASLGVDVILSREVARRQDSVHGLFWQTISLKLAAGVPILASVVVFAVASGYRAAIILTVLLIGLSTLIDEVAQSLHAVLRAVEDMGPPARALALESIVLVALAAIALVGFRGPLVALGVATVLASLVALAYIWRAMIDRGFRPRARTDTTHGLGWLVRAAIPTGITSVFGYALGRIDAVILSAIIGRRIVVGWYGGAYRIFEATLFLSWALGLAVYPSLARLEPGSRELRRTFELSGAVAAAVTVPIGAALALFAPTIVSIVLGSGYAHSTTTTRILGGAAAMYGIYTIAAMTLAAQYRQQRFPILAGAALLLNVALNVILIPTLSLRGAAIAMVAAQACLTAGMLIMVWRLVGSFSVPRIVSPAIVGAGAMLPIELAFGSTLATLVLALLAAGLAMVIFERASHRDDLQLVVGAVRARRGGS